MGARPRLCVVDGKRINVIVFLYKADNGNLYYISALLYVCAISMRSFVTVRKVVFAWIGDTQTDTHTHSLNFKHLQNEQLFEIPMTTHLSV